MALVKPTVGTPCAHCGSATSRLPGSIGPREPRFFRVSFSILKCWASLVPCYTSFPGYRGTGWIAATPSPCST
eukprot:12972768-Heterocapsa_arctica.AAC.1